MLSQLFRRENADAARPTSQPPKNANRVVARASASAGATPPSGGAAADAGAAGSLLRSSPSGPVDSVLAAAVIALIGFGVVMVYSASAIEATVRHHDAQFFLKRQAVYALGSIVLMWLVSRVDY
ncbi:MAG TPA: FtsW/RodA/SpoVE family cell cycle protein, partial [Minicystis sp.]|nr:FtsW/RodA/SpoVE family cell cycle protein [Minicystis sp.]